MIRLHITAEGRTEERFVNRVLSPHLSRYSVYTDVRCVLTSKDKRSGRQYRGGFRRHGAYETVKKDIRSWLKEDDNSECRFSTMFDLYALPDDFPGYGNAQEQNDPYQKIAILENEFGKDISDSRFIPYVQLHEFEALILSDPRQLDWEYLEHDRQIGNIVQMVRQEGGKPELIDDGEETAPSKRILREIPEYDKANVGPIIAEKIGLQAMRNKCPHFDDWLKKLEGLN